MASAKRIGGISVAMQLQYQKFTTGLSATRRHLGKFDGALAKTKLGLKSFGTALIGVASAGAFAKWTKSNMDQIAALSELSTKIGISTTVLAGYTLAAEEAGVSSSAFEKSILTMTKRTRDAAGGVGEIAKVYKILGVDAAKLNSLAPDQQFLLISDAINRLKGNNAQLTATMDIFGTKQSSMINLIHGGRDAFNEAAEAAKRMGLAVEDAMAARIDKASESIDRFKKSVGSLGVKAAVGVTPFVEGINEFFEGLQFEGKRQHFLPKWMRNPNLGPSLNPFKPSTWLEGPEGFAAPEETDPFKQFIRKGRTDAEVMEFRARQFIKNFDARGMMDKGIGGVKFIRDALQKTQAQQAANRAGLASAWQKLLGGDKPPLSMAAPSSLMGALGNMQKFWGGALGPMGRGVMGGLGGAGGILGGRHMAMYGNQGIAGQDPLSREGNAQRVRSLAQNPMHKLGQKQLDEQKKTRVAVEKIARNPPVNLKPANI